MALQYVFHISDIHIRNGDEFISRYREYDAVFSNLFVSLKANTANIKKEEFVIIITGDIFHNKNVIGNYGLALYKKLIKGLVAIGRTIVMHGNHDRNQSETEQPSLVSTTIEMDDLMLLDETTSFVIDGIGFSYVSIDDTLDNKKTCGRLKKLPDFPEIDTEIKVALFHGTFANVRLYNGTEVQETQDPYPFEWISGFNFAMLGDIHLRQSGIRGKTLWGYSGSLVQQNYGEDVINHGYMVWDLKHKSIKEVDVRNPRGLINVKQNDSGDICIRNRGKYDQRLEDFIRDNNDTFPKSIEVRLYSDVSAIEISDVCNKHGITASVVSNMATMVGELSSKTEDTLDIRVDKTSILEYFRTHLEDEQYNTLSSIVSDANCLLFDASMFDEHMQAECQKRNKEIAALISSCNSDTKQEKRPFTIRFLEWSNMYCYEEKNWIDFKKIEASTFIISGANGTGKSAIYDILTYSVWGECTPSRNSNVSSIINHACSSAYTIVDVEANGEAYRICRHSSKNPAINKSSIYSHKDLAVPLKKGNACKELIIALFGTLEEFLSSSMITQSVDYDILRLGYKDCVALVDKAINIDYIYNFFNLLKCCINKYKDVKKLLEGKKSVYERILIDAQAKSSQEIEDMMKESLYATMSIASMQQEIDAIPVDTKDPVNTRLIGINYDEIIKNIGAVEIETDEEYTSASRTFLELSSYFKQHTEEEIEALSAQHSQQVFKQVEKPCEYSIIEAEEADIGTCTISEECNQSFEGMRIALHELKEDLKMIEDEISVLIQNKPATAHMPDRQLDVLQREVETMGGIDVLKSHVPTTVFTKKNNQNIDYEEYKESLQSLQTTCNQIASHTQQIAQLDEKLNDLYEKHKTMVVPRPTAELPGGYVYAQIGTLSTRIDDDTIVLDNFYKDIDRIYEIEARLDILRKELSVFDGEDYAYDPCCSFCCKRPWVSRVRELNSDIEIAREKLDNALEEVYDNTPHDYLEVFTRNEENKSKLFYSNLYNDWMAYNAFKSITAEIESCVSRKEEASRELASLERTKERLQNSVCTYDSRSKELLDEYSNAIAYNTYSEWLASYEKKRHNKMHTDEEISRISSIINYHENIRPRHERLAELKKRYFEWQENESIKLRHYARAHCSLKNKLGAYEKLKECIEKRHRQKDTVMKLRMLDTVQTQRQQLQTLNDTIAKEKTVMKHCEDYRAKLDEIEGCLLHFSRMIGVISIISSRFKDYRIELYDRYILKNIVHRANNTLSLLCHESSKKFQIGYMLTEVKDIIHINWLVKTKSDNQLDNIVSAHQASGFQHFAMSIALRMSIFNNNMCDQMFIDEGFTSCDRMNLSIVPSFLKSLLKMFNSVILVSHIDVIQDSIDNVCSIAYNKDRETSCIMYGECN